MYEILKILVGLSRKFMDGFSCQQQVKFSLRYSVYLISLRCLYLVDHKPSDPMLLLFYTIAGMELYRISYLNLFAALYQAVNDANNTNYK